MSKSSNWPTLLPNIERASWSVNALFIRSASSETNILAACSSCAWDILSTFEPSIFFAILVKAKIFKGFNANSTTSTAASAPTLFMSCWAIAVIAGPPRAETAPFVLWVVAAISNFFKASSNIPSG